MDTDVFVSALRGGGAVSEVLAECLRGTFLPLMGTALFTEYESVLRRPQLFTRSRLSGAERRRAGKAVRHLPRRLPLDPGVLCVAPEPAR